MKLCICKTVLLWSQYCGLYNLDSDPLCLYITTGFMVHACFTKVIFLHLWLSISWCPDYWVWLGYTWDIITTIKVGECDIILNILKKIVLDISHLSLKMERYVYTNLFWLYLPFLWYVVKTYFIKALTENNSVKAARMIP